MADNRKFVQAQDFFLAGSGASASDTTITLKSFKQIDGTNLTMTDFGTKGYGTLDPNTSKEEQLSFTDVIQNADGTATLTGVSGVGNVSPYTETSGLAQGHNGNATFVLSNTAAFYDSFANKNNDETIAGTYTFTSTAIPIYNANPTFTDDKHLISKKYADDLAFAGAPDASETQKGLNEMATSAESQAGTDTGSTTGPLVVKPSDIAKNTQNQQHIFATDTGAADAYVITLAPAITAYATGQKFVFKATNANTTTSTLNVNGLGAKTIKKMNDQNLEANDIEAGQIVEVVYDGTNFQMQTPSAIGLTSANATEANTFFGSTDITGAEAETLTDGSNADSLHTHEIVWSVFSALLFNGTAPGSTTTFSMGFSLANTGTETLNQVVITRAGTIKNLYVHSISTNQLDTTITLRKNGASTALTATLTTGITSVSDTSNSFTVVAGDRITFRMTTSAGAGSAHGNPIASCEFIPT